MITRIKQVQNYRALQRWTCGAGFGDFAQVNVVYGVNGSGKSTLCSLFQDAAADSDWSSGLKLQISEAGARRSVESAGDPFWQRLKVFNRAYVEANLRFDAPVPNAKHLLVLGEQEVQIQEERERLQRELARIAPALQELQGQKGSTERERSTLLTDTARMISDELGRLGGRYNPRSYLAPLVEKRLTEGFTDPGAVDVGAELATVNADPPEALTELPQTVFSLARLVDTVREVLGERVTATVIEDLRDHPDWSRWVQEGLGLHGDRETCIYCTGPITDERRDALARHFDDSLRNLQGRVSALDSELIRARDNCRGAVVALPAPEAIFHDLRAEFVAARDELRAQVFQWEEGIERLLRALAEKRDAPFSALDPPALTAPLQVTFERVASVLARHNQIFAEFEQRRQQAAEWIELARIVGIRDRVADLAAKVNQLDGEMSELTGKKKVCDEDLAGLGAGALDPTPIAKALNDDLSSLLGRSDLAFEVEDDGYQLTRAGEPADHLSEGECNAIALLYFLHSLSSYETDLADCVVLIDDPVSSLDANTLFGASSHLWSRLVHKHRCGQLFLFTHNFELFRHWSGLLQRGQGNNVYGLYDMRWVVERDHSGQAVRAPRLIPWPPGDAGKRLRSEYHYLFWRVADTLSQCQADPSPERDIEAATVLPNLCRRLLEAFLGFKAPAQLGHLRQQVDTAAGGSVDEATRTRVYQFLNHHSHFEEADTTKPVARPEAVEMLHVALEFMKAVDGEHLSAMCEAVGVDGAFIRTVVRDVAPAASVGPFRGTT